MNILSVAIAKGRTGEQRTECAHCAVPGCAVHSHTASPSGEWPFSWVDRDDRLVSMYDCSGLRRRRDSDM